MKKWLGVLILVSLAQSAQADTWTVNASSDDAQQIGTTVTLADTTIGASLDATTEWIGMRWPVVNIPQGATILTAVLNVMPSASTEDEPLVTVFLQNADNCGTYTTGTSDISNRARTTGVSWDNANLGANGSTYFNSPSLVADVQAVVNRAGWVSGNALCVLVQGGATSTRDLTIKAYDTGPGTSPPQLIVTWSVPGSCTGGLLMMGVGSC